VLLGAVGLTSGYAAADLVGSSGGSATFKSRREEIFPTQLLDVAVCARLQDGQASVESDRLHILNALCGAPLERDLNDPPAASHPRYNSVNAILHGRVAAASLRPAVVAGGALLRRILDALRASSEESVSLNLFECEAATAEVVADVLMSLPPSLCRFDLAWCAQLEVLPDLSPLWRLKSLALSQCTKLRVVSCLSAHTQLEELCVRGAERLQGLPDVSTLPQLHTLVLSGCKQLSSIPDLSANTRLRAVIVDGCRQIPSLPGLSLAHTELQRLELSGCYNLWTNKGSRPELDPAVES